MKENSSYLAFNRGIISKLGLGRLDLKRMAMSAEIQTNLIPRVLGSASIRPGTEYIGSTYNNSAALHLPFIFSKDDTAVIELTDSLMRIRVDDDIVSRGTVSSAVTNGNFTSNVTSWTDSDESGATSSWLTGGYLKLIGNSTSTAYARRDQQITVAAGDQGDEHALRIVITRGPVEVKIGSTQGGQEYWGYSLKTGIHSIAFTPTGNFWIRLQSRQSYSVLVDSINVESSGDLTITTPWTENDLAYIRFDQSGDIIYVSCKDQKQKQIERRATRSWSLVDYITDDGPFMVQNTGPTTLLPSALNGDVTLTASADLFESTHVGALFSIASSVQKVTADDITAEDTWTDPIRIIGIGSARAFTVKRSGISDSTITLQRSIYEPGTWTDEATYTTNATISFDDELDNQEIYYRIGIKTGDYGTDTVDLELSIGSGSITGICRITAVTNGTTASAVTLQNFGTYEIASSDWSEGQWSDKRGYPSSVALHDGRLWWAGKDRYWGSVSDAYYSFDPDYEGDAGPINRSIGQGPVDNINWLQSGRTLLMGTDTAIKSIRSSSLEEPITTSNIKIVDIDTQGCSNIPPVKIDKQTIWLQASGIRIYEATYDNVYYDYNTIDLTSIVPEIGEPSITKIVVQRQPDTRIHCVRSDGKVALQVYDKLEDVKCWVLVETDGDVEDALIMPGDTEDSVYYLVNRTIDSSTVRYWEKWALESECHGGATNKLADCHYIYSGASTDTITGLDHYEGEEVVVWGNSKDLGTYTVSSGSITLTEAVTWACIGLYYEWQFKSVKPSLSTNMGTSLLQKKTINQIGLLMAYTHAQGLQYGRDFDNLDDLPKVVSGETIDDDYVWDSYDNEPFAFPGSWSTDSRVCLQGNAPLPCTLVALIIQWNTHEKT